MSVRRVLIIGDSHTAALRQGWDRIEAATKRTAIRFVFTHASQFDQFEVRGHELHGIGPETERFGTIALAPWDDIWIVGGKLGAEPIMRHYARYRHSQHKSHGGPMQTLVSEEAYQSALRSTFTAVPAVRLAAAVARGTDAQVQCVPCPLISDQVVAENRRWRDASRGEDAAQVREEFYEAVTAALPDGVAVFEQPVHTCATPITTRPRFLRGGDLHHMNADYGVAVLEALLT